MSHAPTKPVSGGDAPPNTARETPRSIHPPWLPPTTGTSPSLPGFQWLVIGKLAGMPRPGLVSDEAGDLAVLQALGIRHLISLTREAVDAARLSTRGIVGEHFPIAELATLPMPDTCDLCRRISAWMDAAEPTVVHCRAGLTRTGTILACVLVTRGLTAERAIQELQLVNPRYVQQAEQLELVASFVRELQKQATLPPQIPR
ncbi:MAG TPA: protein-tyrosine phosphatase family protein [Polyangiaceae bacterium]|nr:protein-tyrosine phosphatase family protein [Polyangiaceae bacterium]